MEDHSYGGCVEYGDFDHFFKSSPKVANTCRQEKRQCQPICEEYTWFEVSAY